MKKSIIKYLMCSIMIFYFLSVSNSSVSAAVQKTDFEKTHPIIISDCDKIIMDAMEKSKIVGLSVALVDDKQILWAKGFGYTDKNKNNHTTSTKCQYRIPPSNSR